MLKYTENCLIAMSAAFTTRYDNYLENRYGSNLISVNCFYVEFVENGNMQLNAILLYLHCEPKKHTKMFFDIVYRTWPIVIKFGTYCPE